MKKFIVITIALVSIMLSVYHNNVIFLGGLILAIAIWMESFKFMNTRQN